MTHRHTPIVITLRWTPAGTRWELGAVVGGERGDEPEVIAMSPRAYRNAIHAYREGCAARQRYVRKEAA